MKYDHTSAEIAQLEHYVEGLYEDIPDKLQATLCIFQLSKQHSNLQIISRNDALMSALTRVLVEDGRKSPELAANVLFIFHQLSTFSSFHSVLIKNKTGDSTIKAIEREIDRALAMRRELQTTALSPAVKPKQQQQHQLDDELIQRAKQTFRQQDHCHKLAIGVLQNLGCDIGLQVKILKRNIVDSLIRVLSIQIMRSTWLEFVPPPSLNHNQQLINAKSSNNNNNNLKANGGGFSIAQTMQTWSERTPIVKPSSPVICAALRFLLQLSIFREGVAQMTSDKELRGHLVEVLGALIVFRSDSSNSKSTDSIIDQQCRELASQLLLNLTHDSLARRALMDQPLLIQQFISTLSNGGDASQVDLVLRLLYQCTLDDYGRSVVVGKHPELISACMKLLLTVNSSNSSAGGFRRNVCALACQLALNKEIAGSICGQQSLNGAGLKLIIKRALKSTSSFAADIDMRTCDSYEDCVVMWKLLRVILNTMAPETNMQIIFLEYLDEIMKLLKRFLLTGGGQRGAVGGTSEGKDDPAAMELSIGSEILGTVGSLTIEGFDWCKLCDNYPQLLNFIQTQLGHSSLQAQQQQQQHHHHHVYADLLPTAIQPTDGLTLSCLTLVGTMTMFDETMASRLTSNSTVILPIMMDLLHGKLTDDELTLQLLYFLHGCMSHQGSRLTDWIVQQQQQSDTLQLLLDLWRDDQPAIRGRAESILDLLEQQLLLSKTQQQSAGNSGDNLRPDSGPHSRQQLLSRLRYGRFLWTNYQWAQKTHRDIMHEYSDDTQLLLEIDQCFPGGIVGGKRNSSTAARGYRSGTESRVNEYYNDGGNDGEELSHYHWNTEGVYFTEH